MRHGEVVEIFDWILRRRESRFESDAVRRRWRNLRNGAALPVRTSTDRIAALMKYFAIVQPRTEEVRRLFDVLLVRYATGVAFDSFDAFTAVSPLLAARAR